MRARVASLNSRLYGAPKNDSKYSRLIFIVFDVPSTIVVARETVFVGTFKPGSHVSISTGMKRKQKAKQRNEVKPAT